MSGTINGLSFDDGEFPFGEYPDESYSLVELIQEAILGNHPEELRGLLEDLLDRFNDGLILTGLDFDSLNFSTHIHLHDCLREFFLLAIMFRRVECLVMLFQLCAIKYYNSIMDADEVELMDRLGDRSSQITVLEELIKLSSGMNAPNCINALKVFLPLVEEQRIHRSRRHEESYAIPVKH